MIKCCKLLVHTSWWWTINCLKHVKDNLILNKLLRKVCILLVLIAYVYHNAQFRECKAAMFLALVQSHAAKVSLRITDVFLECTLNGQGFCWLWKYPPPGSFQVFTAVHQMTVLIFCSCDQPNTLQTSDKTDTLLAAYHFCICWKQLSHAEDGGSTFLRNVGAFDPTRGTDTTKEDRYLEVMQRYKILECHHV